MTYEMIGNAEIISYVLEKGLVNEFRLVVRSTDINTPSYDLMYQYCKKYLNLSDEDVVVIESKLYPMHKFSSMVIKYRPEELAKINSMPDGYDKLAAALKYINMFDDVSLITRDDPDGPGYRAWNVEFKTDSLRGRSTGEVVRFVTFFFHDYLRMIVGVTYEHF